MSSLSSSGGNFVTKKRSSLAPKKVEELTLISSNQDLLEDFKESGGYEIIPTTADPLNAITVDLVLQELFEEEEREEDSDEESGDEEYESEESSTDNEED